MESEVNPTTNALSRCCYLTLAPPSPSFGPDEKQEGGTRIAKLTTVLTVVLLALLLASPVMAQQPMTEAEQARNAELAAQLEAGQITLQEACQDPAYRKSGNCAGVTATPTATATATPTATAAQAQYEASPTALPATGGPDAGWLSLAAGVLLVLFGGAAWRIVRSGQ